MFLILELNPGFGDIVRSKRTTGIFCRRYMYVYNLCKTVKKSYIYATDHKYLVWIWKVFNNDYRSYICTLIIGRKERSSSDSSRFITWHIPIYSSNLKLRSHSSFRYQDLVEIYSVSAETIISDAFSYSENV